MGDRIEMTYMAIDEIILNHNTPRPKKWGGGYWDAPEEFAFYKEQVGDRYTELQWAIFEDYFKTKFTELTNDKV